MTDTIHTVLLTGAAGKLARRLRAPLAARYPRLISTDRLPLVAEHDNEVLQCCDLTEPAAVARLLEGVDAIVHFAGHPREGDWDVLIPANIVATCRLWEGALAAGVQRIVYASSNHVVGFHPVDAPVGLDAELKCDSRYGVTKAFAETLARFYYEKYGLPSLGLRIGRCEDAPLDERMLSSWLHPQDMLQLVLLGLTQPLKADLLYGTSRNARGWWLNEPANHRLPFEPQHRADDHPLPDDGPSAPAFRYQGGSFADADYRGDPRRAALHRRR